MALFGNKEKSEKQLEKERALLEKYGLENLGDEKDVNSVKKIINELIGTGISEVGLKLSMAGKPEDKLPVYYQRAILEQNFIIIRQLDKIAKLLENK